MRNKIILEIEWGDKLPFKIGGEYTKGELLNWRKEYTSPKNLTEAFFQASKIIKHDFNLHFNNLCDRTKYLIAEIQEVYRGRKRVFVLSLLAGISVPIFSFTIANNLPFKEMANPQLNVGNGITCLACGVNTDYKNTGVYNKEELEEIIVKPLKKKKVIIKKVETKNTIVDNPNGTESILFNPGNIKQLYDKKYSEELLNPITNKVMKFKSYDASVLYFWYLIKEYNRTAEQKVNHVGTLVQVYIESGMKPSTKGYSSKLGTYANNTFGLKTWKNIPKVWSKDDDYKNGVLIHAGFAIFSDYSDCLDYYGNLLKQKRYHGKVVEKTKTYGYNVFQHTDNSDYVQWLAGMTKSGYCSNKDYAKLGKIKFEKEIAPVLKKYKIDY